MWLYISHSDTRRGVGCSIVLTIIHHHHGEDEPQPPSQQKSHCPKCHGIGQDLGVCSTHFGTRGCESFHHTSLDCRAQSGIGIANRTSRQTIGRPTPTTTPPKPSEQQQSSQNYDHVRLTGQSESSTTSLGVGGTTTHYHWDAHRIVYHDTEWRHQTIQQYQVRHCRRGRRLSLFEQESSVVIIIRFRDVVVTIHGNAIARIVIQVSITHLR